VTVQLHPLDRAALEATLAPRGGVPDGVTLLDAPDQARGGCVVRGAQVTIDARVETALAAIAQAMGVDAPEPEGAP
jgi:flagellar biosynthesis/type III secretory pathway protein FliH